MALTVQQLALSLRVVGDETETLDQSQTDILTRHLETCSAVVTKYASTGTPVAVVDQGCILVASYLWDQPAAGRGSHFATAWINSGASALCEPWRVRRASVAV